MMMHPSGERFLSKEDWAKESEGLPVLSRSESFSHVVVGIQAVGAEASGQNNGSRSMWDGNSRAAPVVSLAWWIA